MNNVLDLEKFGFKKTEKNKWAFWNDYLLDKINGEIGYFLNCTIHIPKYTKGEFDYRYDCCRIVLHRNYNLEYWNEDNEYYDTEEVYYGIIDSDEFLELLLNKLCIISKDEEV